MPVSPAQPWEFFQQPEAGDDIALPLWWVSGAGNAFDLGESPSNYGLAALTIYAVPFDLLRTVNVSKISVRVRIPQTGAAARIRIYKTFSLSNNKPAALAMDSGEIALSAAGVVTAAADTSFAPGRYWAAFMTNNSMGGTGATQIDGIPLGRQFYWGSWFDSTFGSGAGRFVSVTHVLVGSQTYGVLPDPFPTPLTSTNFLTAFCPAIALAFSSVT